MNYSVNAKWDKINHSSSNALYDVSYLTENKILVTGIDGILKSEDGGVTWTINKMVNENGFVWDYSLLYELEFLDENIGFCTGYMYTGNSSLILRTGDGGATWNNVYLNNSGSWPRNIREVKFKNNSFYAAGSNGVFMSGANKGTNWAALPNGGGDYFKAISVINSQEIFAIDEDNIYKSTNAGLTWDVYSFEDGDLADIEFLNEDVGVAVSEDYIYVTQNGGKSWEISYNSQGGWFNHISVSPSGSFYACGYGVVLKSNDGINWAKEDLPVENYQSVEFYDENTGIIVSDSSLYITHDGGASLPTSLFESNQSLFCQDSTITFKSKSAFIDTYEWYVNDSLVGTKDSLNYSFKEGVTSYQIQLIVGTTVTNLKDTSSMTVTTEESLNYEFEYILDTLSTRCPGCWDTLHFPNLAYGRTIYLRNKVDHTFSDWAASNIPFLVPNQIFEYDELYLITTTSNSCGSLTIEKDINFFGFKDTLKHETFHLLPFRSAGEISDLDVVGTTIYGVTGKNKIVKSTDSGKSWTESGDQELISNEAIDFITDDVGYFITDALYRTEDGGNSSTLIENNSAQFILKGIEALDQDTLFYWGDSQFGGSDNFIRFVNGQGVTSLLTMGSSNSYENFSDLSCPSGKTCYLSTSRSAGNGPPLAPFFKSTDRGLTWNDVKFPGKQGVKQMDFLNNLFGFAINGTFLYRTLDGCTTWDTTRLYYKDRIVILSEIKILSNSTAYVVGTTTDNIVDVDYYVVAKTVDGGNCWQIVEELAFSPMALDFVNDTSIIVSGQGASSTGLVWLSSHYDYPIFSTTSKHLCVGTQIEFENESQGFDSFEWYVNDSLFSTAINAEFTPIKEIQYDFKLIGYKGANIDSSEALSLSAGIPSQIIISEQPEDDKVVCLNSTKNITVTASGDELNYRWQMDIGFGFRDTSIQHGIYDYAFGLTNDGKDIGSYKIRCLIEGRCAAPVISDTVSFKGGTKTEIITSPVTDTICSGADGQLNIEVSGDNLRYQWLYKIYSTSFGTMSGSSAYNGEKTATLNTTPGLSTSYKVRIYGECGDVTSEPVSVSIQDLSVAKSPSNLQVCGNEYASFSAQFNGPTSAFKWQVDDGNGFVDIVNNTSYEGYDSQTLIVKNVTGKNDYLFKCIGFDVCSQELETSTAKLTTITKGNLDSLVNNLACSPGTYRTKAYYSSATPPMYFWQIDSGYGFELLAQETSNQMSIYVTEEYQGYKVRLISESCNIRDTSEVLTLNLNENPSPVGSWPSSLTICPQDSFKLTVNSTLPISETKWWYKASKYGSTSSLTDGISYMGTQDSSIIMTPAKAGFYRASVLNEGCGFWSNFTEIKLKSQSHGVAEENKTICSSDTEVELNIDTWYSYRVDSVVWWGESNIFTPDNQGLTVFYQLQPGEQTKDSLVFYTQSFSPGYCPSTPDSLIVSIDLCTKMNEITESYFSVYPNPSTDIINIEVQNPIYRIEILDKTGRLVLLKKCNKNTNNYSIIVTSLAPGLYIVKAIGSTNVSTEKILKK